VELLPLITAWICNGERTPSITKERKGVKWKEIFPGLITLTEEEIIGLGVRKPIPPRRPLHRCETPSTPSMATPEVPRGAVGEVAVTPGSDAGDGGEGGLGAAGGNTPGQGQERTAGSGHSPTFGDRGLCRRQHRRGPGLGWQRPNLRNN